MVRPLAPWYPLRVTARSLSARAQRLALGLMALGLAPLRASAGNGAHLRTPVDWSGAPCMTIIDRSVDPVHSFSYGIPYEDTQLTDDEVSDSRTHQFVAFCTDRSLGAPPPRWLSEADVNAAVAAGLGTFDDVDLELEVLDNAPEWVGCWTRITADAQRRPITFEAAAEPVQWDTSGLAAGTWVIEGYTHEPWANLWTNHPGVFKIVDDPDPAASPPAASLNFPEQQLDFGESTQLSGCADAMPGTTMDLAWALAVVGVVPEWVEFASEVPVESGAFSLEFVAPVEAAASSVWIRARLTDPMGRSWTAYSRSAIGVSDAGSEEQGCGGGFLGGECDETGESSAEGESGAPASEEPAGGCNCATHEDDPLAPLGWGMGLALVGLARLRRRAC